MRFWPKFWLEYAKIDLKTLKTRLLTSQHLDGKALRKNKAKKTAQNRLKCQFLFTLLVHPSLLFGETLTSKTLTLTPPPQKKKPLTPNLHPSLYFYDFCPFLTFLPQKCPFLSKICPSSAQKVPSSA